MTIAKLVMSKVQVMRMFHFRTMMKAIQVAKFGGPEVLKIVNNVPRPIISAKQVSLTVKLSESEQTTC